MKNPVLNRENRELIKRMLKEGYSYDYIKYIYPDLKTIDISYVASEMIEDDRIKIITERKFKILEIERNSNKLKPPY